MSNGDKDKSKSKSQTPRQDNHQSGTGGDRERLNERKKGTESGGAEQQKKD